VSASTRRATADEHRPEPLLGIFVPRAPGLPTGSLFVGGVPLTPAASLLSRYMPKRGAEPVESESSLAELAASDASPIHVIAIKGGFQWFENKMIAGVFARLAGAPVEVLR
jgi:hypothetical protein